MYCSRQSFTPSIQDRLHGTTSDLRLNSPESLIDSLS